MDARPVTRCTLVVLTIVLGLLASACRSSEPPAAASTPSPTSPPLASPTLEPTPPPVRPPKLGHYPTSGAKSKKCVNGWTRPVPGSPLFDEAIAVIRRATEVRGPLVIADMRYFTGPESPPSDQGYLLTVERWYVRLFARRDPAFQGRFLVESRRFGSGLSAVAPWDTQGFGSPDWAGFQWDSAHPAPRSYPGLPGVWSGNRYDFVKGGLGLEFPGIPKAVVGCLKDS